MMQDHVDLRGSRVRVTRNCVAMTAGQKYGLKTMFHVAMLAGRK
jgi:hypothetical protein